MTKHGGNVTAGSSRAVCAREIEAGIEIGIEIVVPGAPPHFALRSTRPPSVWSTQ